MTARILHGHVLDKLADLPAESVHCVVTSPPYWGLRDYKLEPIVWGGDPACEHEWGAEQKPGNYNWAETIIAEGNLDQGHQKRANAQRSQFCSRCNAWRGQLGLEPTPELHVEHLVAVFREVRRAL